MRFEPVSREYEKVNVAEGKAGDRFTFPSVESGDVFQLVLVDGEMYAINEDAIKRHGSCLNNTSFKSAQSADPLPITPSVPKHLDIVETNGLKSLVTAHPGGRRKLTCLTTGMQTALDYDQELRVLGRMVDDEVS